MALPLPKVLRLTSKLKIALQVATLVKQVKANVFLLRPLVRQVSLNVLQVASPVKQDRANAFLLCPLVKQVSSNVLQVATPVKQKRANVFLFRLLVRQEGDKSRGQGLKKFLDCNRRLQEDVKKMGGPILFILKLNLFLEYRLIT